MLYRSNRNKSSEQIRMWAHRLVGPVATLFVAAVMHLDVVYRLIGTDMLSIVALVFSCVYSGLIPGVISAFIVSAFVFNDQTNLVRAFVVSGGCFIMAFMVGLLQRYERLREKRLDDLLYSNSNLLQEGLQVVRLLLHDWDYLSDLGKYRLVQIVEGRIGNLLGVRFGFEQLKKEMEEVMEKVRGYHTGDEMSQSVSNQAESLDRVDGDLDGSNN